MHGASANDTGHRLPPDFRTVPVHATDENVPVRLCLVLRLKPDPAIGHFFLLRDLPGARVYLGTLSDAGENVRQWVELWVQTTDGLDTGLFAHRDICTNQILDQRWVTHFEAARSYLPESVIETNWERRHPAPAIIDLSRFSARSAASPAGGAWELCQNDTLLQQAGLPPYSSSLHRYLFQPAAGKGSPFIAVSGAAPEGNQVLTPAEALGLSDQLIAFNLQCGLMMAMDFHPLGYGEFLDVLDGKPWSGLTCGKTPFNFGQLYQTLAETNQRNNGGANFFLARQGLAGRIVETLHLKLQLLADAFSAVRACVQVNQIPFLNLSLESFRVKLQETSLGLPFFWTAKCALVKPGAASAVQIEKASERFFVRDSSSSVSMYESGGQRTMNRGSGTVRIRNVIDHDKASLIVEGTLVMPEPPNCSVRDILWIRLPLSCGVVDLYGHIDQRSLATAEAGFRTMPLRLLEPTASALQAGEIVFPACQFEVIRYQSSPADLRSLGVLAIRTLLLNDSGQLRAGLDAVLSLARQAALEHKPDTSKSDRIASIFRQKPDWLQNLGPHRLLAETLPAEQASLLIPSELWHEVLGTIIALFPGEGPDSYCADLGDAPASALESVFDRPLADLQQLLVKTRSLVAVDWIFNREVRAVIDQFRSR